MLCSILVVVLKLLMSCCIARCCGSSVRIDEWNCDWLWHYCVVPVCVFEVVLFDVEAIRVIMTEVVVVIKVGNFSWWWPREWMNTTWKNFNYWAVRAFFDHCRRRMTWVVKVSDSRLSGIRYIVLIIMWSASAWGKYRTSDLSISNISGLFWTDGSAGDYHSWLLIETSPELLAHLIGKPSKSMIDHRNLSLDKYFVIKWWVYRDR